jgi:hypothetical protein
LGEGIGYGYIIQIKQEKKKARETKQHQTTHFSRRENSKEGIERVQLQQRVEKRK